jgi:hypothetical protein
MLNYAAPPYWKFESLPLRECPSAGLRRLPLISANILIFQPILGVPPRQPPLASGVFRIMIVGSIVGRKRSNGRVAPDAKAVTTPGEP